MRDLELAMLLSERGDETLRRLHRLVRKGYVPELGDGVVEDAVFLRHLADGPALILYGDGKLVAMGGGYALDPSAQEDRDRIYNEGKADAAIFDHFIATLRQPRWWERTRPAREKYIWQPLGLAVALVIIYGGVFAMLWIIRQLTGWHPI